MEEKIGEKKIIPLQKKILGPFSKRNFYRKKNQKNYIAASISIGKEIQCLLYAGFFLISLQTNHGLIDMKVYSLSLSGQLQGKVFVDRDWPSPNE